MGGLLPTLYAASPVWLQNVAVSAYGVYWRQRRLGGEFRREAALFRARDEFTPPAWHALQTEVLGQLLPHAMQTVPHYRDVMGALGITTADIAHDPHAVLAQLPLLSKDEIRRDPARFLSERPSGKLKINHTSGTSGTPLAVHLTAHMHQRVLAAYEARVRGWAGVDASMSRAMIGGRMVVPRAQASAPYWRHNRAEKQLYMSAYHIGPETVAAYAGALEEFRPDYLVGYASAHFFLARLIDEAGITLRHRPRAVLVSSEKLTPEMRVTLERVYRCEVFDAYSGVEACCMAAECEHHRMHLFPDMGIVEVLDAAGMPARAGESGELVATGLLNFDQPLLRYRTGDAAAMSDVACECGRVMPVLDRLEGRIEDTVIGADGRETVRFHGLYVGIPSIREGQVIQDAIGQFRIKLVTDDTFVAADGAEVISRLQTRIGEAEVRIERVPEIERTANGKFRAVISHVQRTPRGAGTGA